MCCAGIKRGGGRLVLVSSSYWRTIQHPLPTVCHFTVLSRIFFTATATTVVGNIVSTSLFLLHKEYTHSPGYSLITMKVYVVLALLPPP